mgnify:FL=1|tara:strand:- start:1064 stop:2416 length:1353 start_codon:yes stop_codon:yes gene_type:complete
MSVTFNSNNNYNVEIITEADLSNPSTIEYSQSTNTPFVTMKITPINPQTQPVLASNIKIDDIIPDFAWNANVQYNINGLCEPPATPHGVNSSIQHVTGIGVTSNCQSLGFNSFFGNSNESQQGPYEAQNDPTIQANQIANNGVSWSSIILIEVYEDDLGNLVNDQHSPIVAENYNEWLMWTGPIQTPGGPRREITANIYPVYVKAFVYLSFGSGGMTGLTSNTTLNLDIDEVEPTFGCTDPTANNYDSTALIDDGSCIIPPPPPPPPVYSLPPFSFTYAGPLYNLQGNTSPSQPIVTNISWAGNTWALMSFSLDVQPAINILPNSSGVDYHITELYYLDTYGNQVLLNYMPGAGAQSPSYNLIGSGFSYIFQNYNSSNTLSPLVSQFTTPADISASVLFGAPYNIDGVIFLNPPTPITGSSWPIDIICTVTATDSGAITTSHTETLSITV